uniref:Ankyrin repeat-containing protein n=1 Tax=Quercus lobata TaxID=97700 RepID=A0A7N2LU00_QUELO
MDESPGFGELGELYSSLSDGTPEFRKLRELYSNLVKGDESNVIAQYSEWGQRRFEDFTCCRDTILHLAIYMKRENIAKKFLERHVQSGLLPPLTQKNALGDTVLHDAAATNMTSLAKELLIVTPELLSIQNNNSETPLFRAVRFGHTEMFRLLADWVKIIKVPNLPYLTDMNGSTILHMAIIAEFFDLALEIAMKYPDLINIKNEKGMIGLQLLSKNPSAFKSGRKYALLKRFIYYCMILPSTLLN